jgi:hypothetical protein
MLFINPPAEVANEEEMAHDVEIFKICLLARASNPRIFIFTQIEKATNILYCDPT